MNAQDTQEIITQDFNRMKNNTVANIDRCIREMENRVNYLRTYRHAVASSINPNAAAAHASMAISTMFGQPIQTLVLECLITRVASLGELAGKQEQLSKDLAATETATESAQKVLAA